MTFGEKLAIGTLVGGGILGAIVGTAVRDQNQKISAIEETLGRSAREISKMTHVDVTDALIERSVTKSVDNKVSEMLRHSCDDIRDRARRRIEDGVDEAIQNVSGTFKERVTETLEQKVSQIDISEMQNEIKNRVEKKITKKVVNKLMGGDLFD